MEDNTNVIPDFEKHNENEIIISDTIEPEIDERMIEHEKMIEEHNKKREELLERMTITGAYYPSVSNRVSFFVEYFLDAEINEPKKELVSTLTKSDMLDRVLKTVTFDDILENTKKREELITKMNQEFLEFTEWKKDGTITSNSENEKNYYSLEKLENLETESLFKLKLEIFEQEIVQNSEDRELRSSIRKSKNVVELLHYYWEIQQEKVNETE
tara:strand:- start:11854 stop:12495 length:642 start_codon:yes stop_codon:yes gene_type:complete